MKPSAKIVTEYIDYNPLTGIFRWKKSAPPRGKIGEIINDVSTKGYHRISLFGHRHQATHIAWLLMTGEYPTTGIDHRNTNRGDNRWENLRLATQTQNQMNTSIRNDNTSGYKGVHPYKRGVRSKWVAQIGDRHIGYFQTAEEAAHAYDKEALKEYGEFAYLNFPTDRPRRAYL